MKDSESLAPAPPPMTDDEAKLRSLGYKQELRRGFSGCVLVAAVHGEAVPTLHQLASTSINGAAVLCRLSNFAVSFTVVSVSQMAWCLP